MVVLILYNNKISLIRGVTLDILKTVQTNLMIKSPHKQEHSNILDILYRMDIQYEYEYDFQLRLEILRALFLIKSSEA